MRAASRAINCFLSPVSVLRFSAGDAKMRWRVDPGPKAEYRTGASFDDSVNRWLNAKCSHRVRKSRKSSHCKEISSLAVFAKGWFVGEGVRSKVIGDAEFGGDGKTVVDEATGDDLMA